MRPHGNRKTTHRIGTAVLGVVLLAGGPTLAAGNDHPEEGLGPKLERLGRAADEALTSLRDAIEDLPRYAAPEIDGDGNIIMRRLPQNDAPLEGDRAPDEREGERPDRGRQVERDGGVWL
ncbi:hypothetical protein [Tistrella mobilis]|uniref:Uncharacterized protein n=1 Tax=Tistrella mobilis (strain KA081020-065) TaxID=1110502 RepID=I3TN04_TISMK|nr:hypothetical protein [Tistrella mobilis]AFK54142.1 hypothetical protein TMO_2304 [Tistrella mobilis KA081020-065]